jgi:signal transduction histidine kinase
MVNMDQRLIHHMITNLLSNAIKYSPPDSTIYFDVHYQTDQAVLRIRDEGMGIPAEEQTRLFEAFFRAGNVQQIPGTGLGLAIVKQAVEMHGGTITVESAPGAGTAFTITVPDMPPEESRHDDNPGACTSVGVP